MRRLVGYSDSAKVTENLWGERWSKLVANVMGNGLSACTGLPGAQIVQSEPLRRFATRLGSEAIRVGQALGYSLEEILHLPPETIARAGEGDAAAIEIADAQRLKDTARVSGEQRPSMGQDMMKGRRTEIEFLNGYVVREGAKIGHALPANAALTDIVTRVEKGELQPDPRHITDLRANWYALTMRLAERVHERMRGCSHGLQRVAAFLHDQRRQPEPAVEFADAGVGIGGDRQLR